MKSKKKLREEFKAGVREAERRNFNSNLKLAKENADKLVQAMEEGLITKIYTIVCEIIVNLRILWCFRRFRNDNWGDILNHLQAVLRGEIDDRIDTEMAAGIQQVVDLLLLPNPTEADVERALDILVKCGFNPWPGIQSEGD
jgi:hypothetical protein